MKRPLTVMIALWACTLSATGAGLDDVIARATVELAGPRLGFDDGPLTEWVQRAMIEATGAEAALSSPLPSELRIGPGVITRRDLLRLAPEELRLTTTSMTGRRIKDLLERSASRFPAYRFEAGHPLWLPGVADSLFDSFEGLTYEIDLTRPEGDRVVHLARRGVPLDPDTRLVVAVDERRMARGDLEANPDEPEAAWLRDALAAYAQRHPTLDGTWERDWAVLPDYSVTPEREPIDRLARHGAIPTAEVLRLFPEQVARRGEMAYWLARSFGWRESRPSGAYPDVPDSLEPWVDGLLRHGVLGETGRDEFFRPFAPVSASRVLGWLERCARKAGYATGTPQDSLSFRRSLLTGVASRARDASVDTLRRSEVLGMIGNLRLPEIRVLQLPRREADGADGAGAARDRIAELFAANPEGTVVLGAGDTILVRRGVRIEVRGAAAGGAKSPTARIGSSEVPLDPVTPGRDSILVTDLVVDPVTRRVVERRASRRSAGP